MGTRATQQLELFLLGPFRARVDGTEVGHDRWTRRKARLLVTLLALQPRHQLHREQVMDLLWPELDVEQAVNNLHRTIHAARRALEPRLGPGAKSRFLATDKQQVLLGAPGGVWVDLEAFEELAPSALASTEPSALERALALYAGDLLADEPYEPWAEARRERLRSTRRALAVALADAYAVRGRYDLAVGPLGALVATDPADEETHRRIMELAALSGDGREALRQFDRCAEALRLELDAEPEPATVALRDRIARGEIGPKAAPSGQPPPNNLPSLGTRFIGREAEKADAARILAGARLLTLTGPGGVGKSRLALEIASASLEAFPGGVWFVELAGARRPEHVARSVAAVVGVRESRGVPLEESIAAAIGEKRCLIVLDNCEHLAVACSGLAASLLGVCSGLTVLATSREPLGLLVETIRRVGPLAVPIAGGATAEALRTYDAAQLFEDRARRHEREFAISDENATALSGLLVRLEGIALAIELAAARVGTAPLESLAGALDAKLPERRAVRSLAPHHTTMRAAIAWSYELLPEEEKRLFERLSVFAGGFTLEAAAAIGAGGWGLGAGQMGAGVLDSLVDKSLVVAEPGGRLRMLETIREFAAEALAARGEAAAARRAHREWALELALSVEPLLSQPKRPDVLERLDAERENIRAALESSADEPGAARKGLSIALSVWRYWEVRGMAVEGRPWLVRFLRDAFDAGVVDRVRALEGAGVLACRLSDYQGMAATFEERLRLAREAGDAMAVANSLHNLGIAKTYLNRYDEARPLVEEALAGYQALGNLRWEAGAIDSLAGLAAVQGDLEGALGLLEESLLANRRLGERQGVAITLANMAKCTNDRGRRAQWLEEALSINRELGYAAGIADALTSLAELALDEGDAERARALAAEACDWALKICDRHLQIDLLDLLASVDVELGQHERALTLGGTARVLREAEDLPAWEGDREAVARRLERAREEVGRERAEAAEAAGAALTLEEALWLGVS